MSDDRIHQEEKSKAKREKQEMLDETEKWLDDNVAEHLDIGDFGQGDGYKHLAVALFNAGIRPKKGFEAYAQCYSDGGEWEVEATIQLKSYEEENNA